MVAQQIASRTGSLLKQILRVGESAIFRWFLTSAGADAALC